MTAYSLGRTVINNNDNRPRLAKTINVSSPDDPAAEQTEEFLELANGCLCCSIKDTGVAAIEKLMLKKGAFDYILLETTGLADPGSFPRLPSETVLIFIVIKAQSRLCSGAMKNTPMVSLTSSSTAWFAWLMPYSDKR